MTTIPQPAALAEPTPPTAALPTFVLGGAPKSGTTAMAGCLSEHPAVWFSDPKEPFYWADDLPGLRHREGMLERRVYERLFRGAGPHHSAIGEGSTLYLFSQTAVEAISRERPGTKFLFMIRRPDEIAHAFHMQMRYYFYEDVEDFEQAWRLQEERRLGRRVPDACIEPRLLQYRDVASIGSQLLRAADIVPPEDLLVLVFDDFLRSPRAEYKRALRFLGLEDDGRTDFPHRNRAMQPRVAWLTQVMRTPAINGLTRALKSTLPGSARRGADRAKKWLLRKESERTPLSEAFRKELVMAFAPEVEKVERVLGRRLDAWKH